LTPEEQALHELALRTATAKAELAEIELEIIKAKMNSPANASSGGNEDATGESYTPEGVGLCKLHPGIDPRSIMNISKGSFNA
jgi:hypothetical protein